MAKVYVTVYIEKEYTDEDLDRAERRGYGLIEEVRELGNDNGFDLFESTLDVTSQYIYGDSGE
jgi:hypothetical protein